LEKGSCEKIEIFPRTLASPAGAECRDIEKEKKFPPPEETVS
jgi:hypothetical protein